MYKVLHIFGRSDVGGIPTVVYNLCKYINKDKIQFDIACISNEDLGDFGKKFSSLGLNVYKLPFKSSSLKNYINTLSQILKSNNYDAIHIHGIKNGFVNLYLANKYKIPQKIIHSHSADKAHNIKGILYHYSSKQLNKLYATNYVACGELSGYKSFGKKIMNGKKSIILPNAVDTKIFNFNPIKRENIRKNLKINNNFVVGIVGRISYEKNVIAAVKIMNAIKKMDNSIKLLIIGDGDQKQIIVDYINNNKLQNIVTMTGKVDNVEDYYQALDVLIMPSIWEGFPCAAVEAMATGLPVIMSDNITKELNFGEKTFYLSLNDERQWINVIEKLKNDNLDERKKRQYEIKKHGLDIRDTTQKLENLYLHFKNIY